MCERRIESGLEFLDTIDGAETAQGVGVGEGIGPCRGLDGDMILQSPAGCEIEQRLRRLIWQRGEQTVNACLIGIPNRAEPFAWDADVQQIVVGQPAKWSIRPDDCERNNRGELS